MKRLEKPRELQISPRKKSFLSQAPLRSVLSPYSALVQSPFTFRDPVPSPRQVQMTANVDDQVGYQLLGFTVFYFIFNMWTIGGSKLVQTGTVLDTFQHDHYYCYLIPVLAPAFLIFVLVNWLGMKYFRHNA